MHFEKFTSYGRGYRATCSIRSNAQIGFNRGSIHRFGLKDGYAVLFFSSDGNIIGVKINVPETEDGATRLIIRDNNAFISGRSFLEYYNIPYDITRQYEARWSDEHDMLLIDLNAPIERTRVRKHPKEGS